MSTLRSGRRRFMAGVALLALTVRPSLSFAQEKPDCVKSLTVGAWEATGFDDFWTVEQKTSDGLTVTVYDTFVTIGASGLESQDGRYTMDGERVVEFSVSVDGGWIVSADADGFTNFSGTDHDTIVNAFKAGQSASVSIGFDGGDIAGDFTLVGFIQATHVAAELRDEMAASAAADQCEPIDCFFTEAACGAVGLPDDCWELATLRRFRDRTLRGLPQGAADIAAYYRNAPAIVAAIWAGPDARKNLLLLYWTCIIPCSVLAAAGASRACRWLYARHFTRLQRLAAR